MTISLATKGVICPIVDFNLLTSDSLTVQLKTDCISGFSRVPLKFKKGNKVTYDFIVKSGEIRLTNAQLNAALDVIFSIKENRSDADIDSIIIKQETVTGVTILPDNGDDSANVRVELLSTDTDVTAGQYFIALQVNFSATDMQEGNILVDELPVVCVCITDDVIRG